MQCGNLWYYRDDEDTWWMSKDTTFRGYVEMFVVIRSEYFGPNLLIFLLCNSVRKREG